MLDVNRIYLGDCLELMKQIDDESIDLIFTDHPYGKEHIYLYEEIAKEGKRILKKGGFAIFYASDYWFDKTFIPMTRYLNYYYLFHLKLPGQNALVFPRNLVIKCKTLMVFSNGDAKQRLRIHNYLESPERKTGEYHKWQQSIEPAIKLIDAFSKEGDLVLEPCVGGATTLIACMQLNRKFIGFEKDEKVYEIAKQRILEQMLIKQEDDTKASVL